MKQTHNLHTAFPLDAGDAVIWIEAGLDRDRERFDHSLQHGGFLNGVNKIPAHERERLCQKLVPLAPVARPYKMHFTPMTDWHGRSFELAAFILHARTQSAAEDHWPLTCATGMLAEDGRVEAIDGLQHKLKTALGLDPQPAYFLPPPTRP